MKISRRDLFRSASMASGAVLGGGLFGGFTEAQDAAAAHASEQLPPAFDKLQPLGERVKPISTPELQGRIAHAQQLMSDAKPRFDALYVTPGTTLLYYTGLYWWPSERILALFIPRQCEPLIVCPAFEEARLREQLRWPIEIRVWQEDESPYTIAAKWFGGRGGAPGKLGIGGR